MEQLLYKKWSWLRNIAHYEEIMSYNLFPVKNGLDDGSHNQSCTYIGETKEKIKNFWCFILFH